MASLFAPPDYWHRDISQECREKLTTDLYSVNIVRVKDSEQEQLDGCGEFDEFVPTL